MSENMYDAWDNGDRHEIRQQFAKREKERIQHMTDRELMRQALEALMDAQLHNYALKHKETDDLIAALRERLAQPETVMAEYKHQTYAAYKTPDGEMKIGVVPEQEPVAWMGLTEEDWLALGCKTSEEIRVGLAIQAKLKEKNAWT